MPDTLRAFLENASSDDAALPQESLDDLSALSEEVPPEHVDAELLTVSTDLLSAWLVINPSPSQEDVKHLVLSLGFEASGEANGSFQGLITEMVASLSGVIPHPASTATEELPASLVEDAPGPSDEVVSANPRSES